MKYCPQCQKKYDEAWITFCSDDGAILIDTGSYGQSQPFQGSQRPPYAPPSFEQPTWRSPDPNSPGGWSTPEQRQPMQGWQPPPPPGILQRPQQSQGLAVASMIVGIVGMFVGLFCLGPIPGIVAIVLGLVSLSQIKKAPDRNGGKPFAIVGIVTGSLTLLFYGAIFFFAIVANIFS